MNTLGKHLLPLLGVKLFISTFFRSIRIELRIRYRSREAIHRLEEVESLMRCVGAQYKGVSAMFTGIGYDIYNSLGNDLRFLPQGMLGICWEAPIAIVIYLANRPVLGLGIELVGNQLHIRQIQSVSGARVNKNLQNWPHLFVAGCVLFAQEKQTIREIRLYKADQLAFYYAPIVFPRMGETYEEASAQCRQRLRRRYDGTARALGFKKHKKYYSWSNLNYARS